MATLGKSTLVLHGQYNLTGSLDQSDMQRPVDMLDSTVYGLDSKIYVPGLKDGSLNVGGLADPTATGIDAILDGSYGSQGVAVTYALGTTVGAYAYLMSSALAEYAHDASVTGLVRISGSYKADQDGAESGTLIFPVTTDTASGEGTGHDRGAGNTTSGGAVAHLHVTAASGTTPTLDVLVEMDDNASFTSATTLITFAQATAATSERVEVATSAERYIRISYTIGGTTPSFTFAVSWAAR